MPASSAPDRPAAGRRRRTTIPSLGSDLGNEVSRNQFGLDEVHASSVPTAAGAEHIGMILWQGPRCAAGDHLKRREGNDGAQRRTPNSHRAFNPRKAGQVPCRFDKKDPCDPAGGRETQTLRPLHRKHGPRGGRLHYQHPRVVHRVLRHWQRSRGKDPVVERRRAAALRLRTRRSHRQGQLLDSAHIGRRGHGRAAADYASGPRPGKMGRNTHTQTQDGGHFPRAGRDYAAPRRLGQDDRVPADLKGHFR